MSPNSDEEGEGNMHYQDVQIRKKFEEDPQFLARVTKLYLNSLSGNESAALAPAKKSLEDPDVNFNFKCAFEILQENWNLISSDDTKKLQKTLIDTLKNMFLPDELEKLDLIRNPY